MHFSHSDDESALGLFFEEDLEFWVPPTTLALALAACVAASVAKGVSSCYLGGCWGMHASNCDYQARGSGAPPGCAIRSGVNETLATLSDGSELLRIGHWPMRTGRMLARCVGAYALPLTGVHRTLAASSGAAEWVHPTDHHINSLGAFDRSLVAAWIEPPMACQVRGLEGSRTCFANNESRASCPPASLRAPSRDGARLDGELGVAGCGADRYADDHHPPPATIPSRVDEPPPAPSPPLGPQAAPPEPLAPPGARMREWRKRRSTATGGHVAHHQPAARRK